MIHLIVWQILRLRSVTPFAVTKFFESCKVQNLNFKAVRGAEILGIYLMKKFNENDPMKNCNSNDRQTLQISRYTQFGVQMWMVFNL